MPDPARILITGFSGFVGGYLVALCQNRYPDAQLFGLTQRLDAPSIEAAATARTIVPLVADMVQVRQVREAIAQSRPDLVFHLAAQASVAASWGDPLETLAINAGGAVHLFEALRAEHLVPRIVLVGSGEQYGLIRPDENPIREECLPRPASPYAVSKVTQDLYGYQYFVAYGLPILRVRPFNHFGPYQSEAFVVASFARQIARIEAGLAEPVLLVGNLEARRDFLPVEDVVRAYIAIADSGHPGAAYNVGSGQARSIQQMLDALLAHAHVPIEIRTDPARLRPTDVPLLVADTSRLREHTGWKPSDDADAALLRTLDYWRQTVGRTLR
ncbi:MAG TPA: GDP-mannose 4,6-dehydratase [Ktedonobacterales bacterium]|nr:GDP-mannose 4,6-dehydratase [Ktedonobacterales bacterium]